MGVLQGVAIVSVRCGESKAPCHCHKGASVECSETHTATVTSHRHQWVVVRGSQLRQQVRLVTCQVVRHEVGVHVGVALRVTC